MKQMGISGYVTERIAARAEWAEPKVLNLLWDGLIRVHCEPSTIEYEWREYPDGYYVEGKQVMGPGTMYFATGAIE